MWESERLRYGRLVWGKYQAKTEHTEGKRQHAYTKDCSRRMGERPSSKMILQAYSEDRAQRLRKLLSTLF